MRYKHRKLSGTLQEQRFLLMPAILHQAAKSFQWIMAIVSLVIRSTLGRALSWALRGSPEMFIWKSIFDGRG